MFNQLFKDSADLVMLNGREQSIFWLLTDGVINVTITEDGDVSVYRRYETDAMAEALTLQERGFFVMTLSPAWKHLASNYPQAD